MSKYIAGLIALAAVFLGGFYVGRGQKEIEIQEKIVEVKGETTTVYRDRIVTVTKVVKPDGTTEETTRTEEKEGRKEEKTVDKSKEKDSATRSIASNYSLGLKYWASLDDKSSVGNVRDTGKYELTAGRRLLGDVWLGVGYKLDKQVSLGISVHF
jgi:hypothetical protein